ncbi:hypothetical protein ACNOHN_04405 [Bacteroides zhangwenhongii]|jgi:hypothetical protein|uniref:hypothetical protein n=1 Tax=Bacteroides TaxID=816 RepID=UPI000822EBA2|nr:hypothetical protein [Bacteroides finegoldii]SCH49023.1 Uncharacterised protein [uncultured Bacteroides sp.]
MKKLFYLLFVMCTVVFTACSSDDDNKSEIPQLNFEKSNYTLASKTVDIKLIADAPAAGTISVPVSFSGAATETTDFTASANAFTFKAGETEAVITLTRVEGSAGDENKTLTVNLGNAPAGYNIGVMSYTTVTLLSKNGVIMSFEDEKGILTLTTSYSAALTSMSGSTYKATDDLSLNVEVDPSSTAVEGVHFDFVDGKKYVTIAKGKNKGTVSLKFLKKEKGKDKLVLRLSDRDGFAYGNNPAITITIQGACNLEGTWAFKEVSNFSYWKDNMGISSTDMTNFPTGTSADQITFTGNSYTEYTFTPELSGSLKNYFGSTIRKVKFKVEEVKELWEQSYIEMHSIPINVSVYTFPNINGKFSSTQLDIREAEVSFRSITVDGKEILECTIDDYIPTDFLAEAWEGNFQYWEETPPMLSNPLRIHFTRVE